MLRELDKSIYNSISNRLKQSKTVKASSIEQVCCVSGSAFNTSGTNEVKNIILTYRKSIRHRTVHLLWVYYCTIRYYCLSWVDTLGVSFALLHGHSLISVS